MAKRSTKSRNAAKVPLVIPGARFSGYEKKYNSDGDAEIVLKVEGDATDQNLEILGAPLATPHSKSWTSDRIDSDVSAKLIAPAFGDTEAKVAHNIPSATVSSVRGDHQSETVGFTLKIKRGVPKFTEWEDQLGKGWGGQIELYSTGQRALFESEDDGGGEDERQKSIDD